jgi:hypothetical protein
MFELEIPSVSPLFLEYKAENTFELVENFMATPTKLVVSLSDRPSINFS